VRFAIMIVLMGVLGWGQAACGGDASTATPPTGGATSTVASAPGATNTAGTSGGSASEQVITVTLQEFSITPADISVNAGKVRFVVTNIGTLSHNFTIMDSSGVVATTGTFPANESPKTIEVDLKAGTYQTLCTVPGHAQHGQRGTITAK
jgi:uncharacterized cupredoxin-like copper-binding protein